MTVNINLELWELNLILTGLAKLPYEESGAVIHRIKEQVEPSVTHCKDCAWFAPVESVPEAEALHRKLIDTFSDCLPRREGECGICRKVTYSPDKPVLTRPDGYCHRAERRKADE